MHPDPSFAGNPSVQLQFGQRHQYVRQRQAAAQCQLLAAVWRGAEQVDQRVGRQSRRALQRRRAACPTLQAVEDVLDCLHQRRTLADQFVAATGAGMMDRAGNRIHLAALLSGQARRDQGTAGRAGLHHQGAQRQATDNPVVYFSE